jgi:hypothetical protein
MGRVPWVIWVMLHQVNLATWYGASMAMLWVIWVIVF